MHRLYMTILSTSTYWVTVCMAGDFMRNGHINVQALRKVLQDGQLKRIRELPDVVLSF